MITCEFYCKRHTVQLCMYSHQNLKKEMSCGRNNYAKQRSQDNLHHLKDWTGDIQNNCKQHNPQKHYKPKT